MSTPTSIVLIDAPSNLGLKRPTDDTEPGTCDAPRVLRELGLLERLRADDAGDVPALAYSGERDAHGVLHGQKLVEHAIRLADALQAPLDGAAFPLVLGGDCSVLLGAALALRRRGRYGLLFIDGHRDLLTPETSQSGGAAGMDLALSIGRGPETIARIEGYLPLVAPEDVIVFGHRDDDRWYAPELLELADSSMRSTSLDQARAQEIDRSLKRSLAAMLDGGAQGFWIHLDVDVLDDNAMYAVDSREPGGMTIDELVLALRTALATGKALGMHVTIYDPERDPDRACGKRLVDALVKALRETPDPTSSSG